MFFNNVGKLILLTQLIACCGLFNFCTTLNEIFPSPVPLDVPDSPPLATTSALPTEGERVLLLGRVAPYRGGLANFRDDEVRHGIFVLNLADGSLVQWLPDESAAVPDFRQLDEPTVAIDEWVQQIDEDGDPYLAKSGRQMLLNSQGRYAILEGGAVDLDESFSLPDPQRTFSPDGQHVARPRAGRVNVQSVVSPTVVHPHPGLHWLMWSPDSQYLLLEATNSETCYEQKAWRGQWITNIVCRHDLLFYGPAHRLGLDSIQLSHALAVRPLVWLSDDGGLHNAAQNIEPAPELIPSPTPIRLSRPRQQATTAPATPLPELGFSPSSPFPQGTLAESPWWHYQIDDLVRGDAATAMVTEANPRFNAPPPSGYAYLLLNLSVQRTSHGEASTGEINAFDFRLLGSSFIRHRPVLINGLDNPLDALLTHQQQTTGWLAFLIPTDEDKLLLLLDDNEVREAAISYLAVDDAASLTPPDSVASSPNQLGVDFVTPAPLGETVVSNHWAVTILESLQGQAALTQVQAANDFNTPDEGMQYVIARVQVRYLGDPDWPYGRLSSVNFDLIGASGKRYERPIVLDFGDTLNVELLPGGQIEGWVALQGAIADSPFMLEFDSPYEQTNRYLALEAR